MQVFQLTKEVVTFLMGNGSVFCENGEPKYIHCPFWFEHIESNDYYIHNFENLPDALKVRILEQRDNRQIYYYEGNPYAILHEGKVKVPSIMRAAMETVFNEEMPQEDYIRNSEQFAKANKDSKWMDVVIYEPLYPECEIRVCVKEKTDFYKNYKLKTNEDSSTSISTQ